VTDLGELLDTAARTWFMYKVWRLIHRAVHEDITVVGCSACHLLLVNGYDTHSNTSTTGLDSQL